MVDSNLENDSRKKSKSAILWLVMTILLESMMLVGLYTLCTRVFVTTTYLGILILVNSILLLVPSNLLGIKIALSRSQSIVAILRSPESLKLMSQYFFKDSLRGFGIVALIAVGSYFGIINLIIKNMGIAIIFLTLALIGSFLLYIYLEEQIKSLIESG